MTPFDYSKTILVKSTYEEPNEKDYSAFVMNKIFSCHMSSGFFAQAINKYTLSDKMNYDFYYYAKFPSPIKFIPYNAKKLKKDEEVLLLVKYYQCNSNNAKNYYDLLSDDEKNEIYKLMRSIP